MPTAVTPSVPNGNEPQWQLGVGRYGVLNHNAARILYFPYTVPQSSTGEVWQSGSRMCSLSVGWEATASTDAVSAITADSHTSAVAISVANNAAERTGNLVLLTTGGKRPLQVDGDVSSTVLPIARVQERYRHRRALRRRFFYFDAVTLTGDTSYTWASGIGGIRHVVWFAAEGGDTIAATYSGSTVTLTGSDKSGTLMVESVR